MSQMRQKRPNTEAIELAAFDLLARQPNATLADIAAHAGVGRATLHRHFASRDVLMERLALRAHADMDAAVEAVINDAKSNLDACRLVMAEIIPLADRQVFLSQDPSDLSGPLRATFEKDRQDMQALIEAMRHEGSLTSDMPTPWIAEVFDALTYAAWTAIRTQTATPSQATTWAWETFINGITKGPNT